MTFNASRMFVALCRVLSEQYRRVCCFWWTLCMALLGSLQWAVFRTWAFMTSSESTKCANHFSTSTLSKFALRMLQTDSIHLTRIALIRGINIAWIWNLSNGIQASPTDAASCANIPRIKEPFLGGVYAFVGLCAFAHEENGIFWTHPKSTCLTQMI